MKQINRVIKQSAHYSYTMEHSNKYYHFLLAIFVVLVLELGKSEGFPTTGNAKRLDNPDERGPFFQGDIVLPEGSIRGGVIGETLKWPNNTIIYSLDKDFTEDESEIILAAMDEITSLTCVSFQNRSTETGYVFIQRGGPSSGGCWSLAGHLGVAQLLNLQADGGCIQKGIAMHELLHTIGFYHEQSRTDRDEYITINFDNVEKGKEGNFLKIPSHLYNITYDYGSIMHYSRYAFAVDPTIPTIQTADPDVTIGQRTHLSQADIDAVNSMYCPDEEEF